MKVTPDELTQEKIIAKFIAERRLLEIPREFIVDASRHLERKADIVRLQPFVTPTVEYNPVTGTVPTQYENDRKMVSHKDLVEFINDVPANNADAVYTVPAGELKTIDEIYADLETVPGGANKDFTITIAKGIAGAAGLLAFMVTGAIAVVPGTPASIGMARNGPTWLNNAAVIANEDTNITGIKLQAADTITATWTNKVADDRCRLAVAEIDLPVI